MPDASDQRAIVVGWDGSPYAEDALELGRLIGGATGARVIAAEVSVDRLGVLRRHGLRHEGERTLAVPANGPRGARVEPRTIVSSSAGRGLHDLAEEIRAELVVLGSTHRGRFGRVFLGSVAEDLIHGAPCAVAVAPAGYTKRYANRLLDVVVAAFDGSPEARLATEAAVRIATAASGSLRVIGVLEPPPLAAVNPAPVHGIDEIMADEESVLRRLVDELVAGLPEAIRPRGEVVSGHAARILVQETAETADLLVLGSRGYGPVGRTFLGSVSAEIVHSAACPVMVVPRGANED